MEKYFLVLEVVSAFLVSYEPVCWIEQVNNETQRYSDTDDVYEKFQRGLSRDSLKKLPHHVILETAKQNECCTICLQVSQSMLSSNCITCEIMYLSLVRDFFVLRTLTLEKLQGGCHTATTCFT